MSVTQAAVIPAAAHLELVAIEVARLAAAFVLDHADRATPLRTKSTPTDVVTETDLASESLIRRELQARCPGSTIVGEEYDDMVGSNEIGWIVDPIDGTVNFLYGLPVVSVSIAASLGGQIVAGAVADTRSGQVYSARLGGGARLGDAELSVSSPLGLGTALIGTGFAYDAEIRREQAQVLTQLLPTCRDIRCMGSAALNLCFVGAGLLDGYFERDIKLYDYAAGALIAAESGAVVHVRDEHTDLTWAATPPIASALGDLVGATR